LPTGGIGADEFPSFPPYREDNMVEVSAALMSNLIDKTIFSVAQEGESNFNLAGILLEKESMADGHYLRMVTSDGHRLSMMEGRVEGDLSNLEMDRVILIPRKGDAGNPKIMRRSGQPCSWVSKKNRRW
jgi:DNA polymerase III subunit beta